MNRTQIRPRTPLPTAAQRAEERTAKPAEERAAQLTRDSTFGALTGGAAGLAAVVIYEGVTLLSGIEDMGAHVQTLRLIWPAATLIPAFVGGAIGWWTSGRSTPPGKK